MVEVSPLSSKALSIRLAASVPGTSMLSDLGQASMSDKTIYILVGTLGFATASALALDAGWSAVELAALHDDDAPIPLVSYEQPPTVVGGVCRIRGDLPMVNAALDLVGNDDATVLFGAPVYARPLTSRIVRDNVNDIVLIPLGVNGDVSADTWWVSGVLIRLLLEEAEGLSAVLDEAAGIAVSLVHDVDDVMLMIERSVRWQHHLSIGGSEDDLRVAGATDSIGLVPKLIRVEGKPLMAVEW